MTRLDHNEDVFVQLVDFKDIPGEELVTQNADGSFTVLINARLNYERQMESFEHAMRHIESNDFEKQDVQQIEAAAHQIADREQAVRAEEFRALIEKKIKKLARRRRKLERQLKEIDKRNKEMEEDYPEFFEGMESSWIEKQRLG